MADLTASLLLILSLCFSHIRCQSETGEENVNITNLNLPEGSECLNRGEKGKCVSAYNCLSVLVGLKMEQRYYAPLCTFKNDVPVVCCTDCDLIDDIREATFISQLGIFYRNKGGISQRKCIQYLEDLPYSCKRTEPTLIYIINPMDYDGVFNSLKEDEKYCARLVAVGGWSGTSGVDASRGEFPHMALLGYGPDLDSAQYHCGGSIISEKYILTAAHCISSVLLGPVKYLALGILKRTDPPELWRRYNVKRIIPHPQYNAPSKYHDIALLEVDTEIKFEEAVLPACLNTDNHEFIEAASQDYFFKDIRKAFAGDKLIDTHATGWGRLGYHERLADVLQKIRLEKYGDDECSTLYPEHRHLPQGYDNSTQMCYGDYKGFADTCSGDSGGPLQVSIRANVLNCQHKVFGVVSSGNPCGTKGGAGLYTRVDYYIPWIESIVWPGEK